MERTKTILGISLGTRSIGIAVLKGENLMDWRVKSFKGEWSKMKLNKILSVLDDIINGFGIQKIIIKIPDSFQNSFGLELLLHGVLKIAKENCISCKHVTTSVLKRWIEKKTEPTKGSINEILKIKFPQLNFELKRESINRNPYYFKMLEAISVVFLLSD